MICRHIIVSWLLALALASSFAASAATVEAESCVDENVQEGRIPDAANAAFHDGRYTLAAEVAAMDASAAGLAFAARARIADALTRKSGNCLECLVAAEAFARKAIAAATSSRNCGRFVNSTKTVPALAEGYTQLAIALGFHGRLLRAMEAQSEGLAEEGRKAIDNALSLTPLSPWARAALGGWHLEIVRRAGPVLASTLYGASEKEGLKQFRSALAAAPDNALLNYHFALSLLALDARRYRTEASAALAAAEQSKQSDVLTRFTAGRASLLLAIVMRDNEREIEALVHFYQGYPSQP